VGTAVVSKTIEPFVDPANLLIIDRDPVGFDNKKDVVPADDELLRITRDNVQCLFNEIWKLPRSVYEDATCAELPKTKYGLPREKPIPQKAPFTRWEKFAQSKGITAKSKRDKKVWDEESETWKPRYGYHRGNDNTRDWLIEIPDNKDSNADYFKERLDAKKERVAKNQVQRLRNIKGRFDESNRKIRDGFSSSNRRGLSSARGANAIPLGNGNSPTKQELGFKIHHAKQATASAGKFQDRLKGEKTPKMGIKRKFEPNEQDAKAERSKQLAILDRMAAKKPKINQARINAAAEASYRQGDGDRKAGRARRGRN